MRHDRHRSSGPDPVHHSLHRPPWWPDDEPWPPVGRHAFWARGRRRFVRRVGVVLAFALFLTAASLIALLTAAIERDAPARWWSGPVPFVPLVILGGTYLAFFFAMRRIGTPLGDIVTVSHRVTSGDYDARVVERGSPFMRGVARTFNNMTATLQAQDRQRRQLMADIAHELRTPLTVVQGRLEGLVDGVYPRDEAQLTEVLEETRTLSRLVDDLRTLANAEAGNLSLHKEPTDLTVLIHDAVGTFAADAAAAGITLRVEDRAELPLVDVAPLRVREVLVNLLANALRHTSAGGAITVTAGPCLADADAGKDDPQEAGMVAVSVSDTGSGIAADDLPRIFDRFYKGATSGGSGLGLAIVRNLVIAHGGDISATSELGRGTTVTFTLPISRV